MKRAPILFACLCGLLWAGCPSGGTSTGPTPTPPTQTGTPAATGPAAQQPAAEAPKPPPPPPAEPQELTFPEEEFRTSQPAAGDPRPLQIPEIETFELKNGIDVYLVSDDKLPVASIELNFDGGSMNDPAGKEGMASVCMAMMSEGTKKLEKIEFEEALADIASRVSSYAGRETQGVSMRTLTKHMDETYDLYVQTLLEPRFAQEDFDRMIKQRLDSLEQAKAAPASVARRVSDRVLYGDKHPFGSVTTEESLKALTVEDCVKYHAAYIKPKRARLFVVGKVTEKQIRAKFGAKAERLASWKGKAKRSARLRRPRPEKGKLFFVHVDDAEQSQIYFMHFGPKRKARDYYATMGAGRILGGGFTSRLNMNLREDKGYSYGARGGFGYSKDYGEFYARSSVRSDSTWQSVKEIYSEIQGLASGKQKATKEELEREKNAAILGLPGDFATMGQVLGAYRGLVYYGLPLDYYDSYVSKVQKLNLRQVNRAARRHLSPKKAIILVVGNAEAPQKKHEDGKDVPLVGDDGEPVTLLDGLRDLVKSNGVGRGKVVLLDADGKIVKEK